MNKYSVLLVADQPVVATLIKLCLYESGIGAVVEVASELAAIEALKERKFNLIISNIEIPAMTGVAIINHLKADSNLSSIPVVMMTSARQLAEVPELKNKDVAGYIMKPFTRESVMGVVESVVGDASAIRM
jgi:two-component system chemotaxis response regulator CheY